MKFQTVFLHYLFNILELELELIDQVRLIKTEVKLQFHLDFCQDKYRLNTCKRDLDFHMQKI